MLFNSLEFLIFFAIVFSLYAFFSPRVQNYWLLAASYVFYGAWDPRFLALLMFTTLVDYGCAIAMENAVSSRVRKTFACLSVGTNLAVLITFKYFGFFAGSFAALLNALGLTVSNGTLSIVLPVGISFYTFQAISYSLDVYAKRISAVRNLADFALYICFFPQLVAGPIERAKDLLPQIQGSRSITWQGLRTGGYLFVWGLFKKCVVADNLAPMADAVFSEPISLSALGTFIGVVAFAFQIYGDFSGYTDMARGLAAAMGFRLSENFLFPYTARNIRDFWHRWHITLSQWFRDYVYIPLGGNRRGPWKTVRNILATMALAGLWHGASWHFVAWGLYHGGLLAAYHAWASAGPRLKMIRLPGPAAGLITFFAVVLGWVLFRAPSMAAVYRCVFGCWTTLYSAADAQAALRLLFFAGALFGLEALAKRRGGMLEVLSWPMFSRALYYALIVFLILIYGAPLGEPFIYFQF